MSSNANIGERGVGPFGRRIALVGCVAVLVAGCTSDADDRVAVEGRVATESAATDVSTTTTTAVPSTTSVPTTDQVSTTTAPGSTVPGTSAVGVPVPATDLDLLPCGQIECATVEVPIDPDQPALGNLEIAINVVRSAQPDTRRGYLLVNPGGPGASGKQFAEATPFFFPRELLDAFDIVGFDPRGVAESEPNLSCGGRDALREQTDQVTGAPDTADEVRAMETAVAGCVEATGPAAAYLGTEFVAHDMDVIRRALGAEQISYYGASYGSEVGVWFATLYPQSVRAMVVDGADNPIDELATQEDRIEAQLEQIRAFEELLGLALDSCDTAACPIFNGGDPTAYYLDAMTEIELVDEARPNLDDAGLFGVISTLYAEASWPLLHQGLFELREFDDPTILARSSDLQASSSDIREIEWINCLDSWSLSPELDRETRLADSEATNEVFDAEFPLLSAASIEEDNTSVCPFLDSIAPDPLEIPLDGGDVPILVIGNPSDPATPFTESVELVEDTLANGYLLEADNPEHVVYSRGNDCVDDIVNRVLIDIEFPDERRVVCARR